MSYVKRILEDHEYGMSNLAIAEKWQVDKEVIDYYFAEHKKENENEES